ncbi:MAG: hypothetical protein R6V31_04860 [Halohasta sp.]
MPVVVEETANEPTHNRRSTVDHRETMNKLSIGLLVLVALAVAGVVGMLVLLPPGVVENPPTVGLPVGLNG